MVKSTVSTQSPAKSAAQAVTSNIPLKRSSPSQSGGKNASPPTTNLASVKPAKNVVDKKVVSKSFTVEDSLLIDSLQFMRQNSFLPVDKSSPHFDSVVEAEGYAKESVVSAVKDKINALKSDISELQKAGFNLHFESIKLLHLPLKVKVWTAHPLRKDLEALYAVFARVEPVVTKCKQELEQKNVDKEKKLVEEEKAWEQEKAQRKKAVQELSMTTKTSNIPSKQTKPLPTTEKKVLTSKKPIQQAVTSKKVV